MANVLVVPTVTAHNALEFSEQIAKVSFAPRLHIDICDGAFANPPTINLAQVYAPENVQLDLHLMMQEPGPIETIISLRPSVVFVHAEANTAGVFESLEESGIKAGMAVLASTSLATLTDQPLDYLLIFSGRLGYQGGQFDESMLERIREARTKWPHAQIAVDGGINIDNAKDIVRAGADILYCGGYLQSAPDPRVAWQKITEMVGAL